ncbi:CMRF35-like molecule 9 isoform X2 [Tachysurus fulvidraco]|uniref:CMRF35-like molecule 9 isoform X2 n=1 Tax=Tachysurus fulvidraco TaxID=1234273 RepID=UPI001FEE3273|nr:CMRF35-like molecule 9 isoform X2 [Tachysurus fulvidraco]
MYSYIEHCGEVRKKSGDVKRPMQTYLRTLSFFQVLICVTMKSKAESVFTGTEGGNVDISCKYAEGYKYTPMYFCRHPCTYSNVLIKSEKANVAVSKGRYTAINTVSVRSFSVTIKHLIIKDSGVYYCGVDKWGYDKLTKVKLTVSEVTAPESTHAPVSGQNQRSEVTKFPSATIITTATAACSTLYEQTSSTTQFQPSVNSHGQLLAVCVGVLGLILCCVLVTLLILYRKAPKSVTSLKPPASEIQISHPPLDQEDIFHVYDEMLAVYSLAGPARGAESSATYSTIQLPAPVDNDFNPYSLVSPH